MVHRYVCQSTQVLQVDEPDCENHLCIRGCVPGVDWVLGVYYRCENAAMEPLGFLLTSS